MEKLITIRRVNSVEEFRQLREAWDGLLARSPENVSFLTWEWLFAWSQGYCCPDDLWLLTAWQGDGLVGIAPLVMMARRKLGFNFRMLINIGAEKSDVSGFIIDPQVPEAFKALMDYLDAHRSEWDVLEVNEIKGSDPFFTSLAARLPASRYTTLLTPLTHLVIPLRGVWETYFSSLSRNMRDSIRKKSRGLSDGSLEFRSYVGAEMTVEHMQAIIDLAAKARFMELYQTDIEKDFQFALVEAMRSKGWLYVGFLYSGEQLIAYRYGFLYDNRFEDWRSGFDEEQFSNSPGKVLLAEVIRDCYARGVTEIDLLRGLEAYKYSWLVEERLYCQYRVLRRRLPVMLAYRWLPALKTALQDLKSRWKPAENTQNTEKTQGAQ